MYQDSSAQNDLQSIEHSESSAAIQFFCLAIKRPLEHIICKQFQHGKLDSKLS